MVFASPRGMCESWRRHRQRVKDPEDRSKPGNLLRIKTDVGYIQHWFRYDLPIPKNFFDVLHPDDIKKLRKGQIPPTQDSKKTSRKRR
mgnify:FL=1